MNSIYASDLGSALFGNLADIVGDIILKTDRYGFIERSSPGLRILGYDTDGQLIPPHICDLAEKRFAIGVREYAEQVIGGSLQTECTVFPLARNLLSARSNNPDTQGRLMQKWFALRMRLAPHDGSDDTVGALAVLRAIDDPHLLAARGSVSLLIDPLTGFHNRQAFNTELGRRIAADSSDVLTMIEIDSFRSLHHRFGPSSGEELICAFADFLLVILGHDSSMFRLNGARFAFFLGSKTLEEARDQVDHLLHTFVELSRGLAGSGPAASASAGLTFVGNRAELAISRAEKALILAGTDGGAQVKIAEELPHYLVRV